MRRRAYVEEQENHERWLISYADFITLLFAFFVVMYSISSVNTHKYTALTSALGDAFNKNGDLIINSAPKSGSGRGVNDGSAIPKLINPINLTQLRSQRLIREKKNMRNIAHSLEESLSPLVQSGKIKITLNEHGLNIDLYDSLLFTAGSADLSENATSPIHEIAQQLKSQPNMLAVEGHTDNTPINNQAYRSNWELSAIRASRLVNLLSAEGIDEKRLSATGYGASRPIAENADELGRTKNRRVAIVVNYKNLP